MINTKSYKIKQLENQIQKLNQELKISDMIIFHQSEEIDTLEKKVEYQSNQINILLKRIYKDDRQYFI